MQVLDRTQMIAQFRLAHDADQRRRVGVFLSIHLIVG
jgi:hypothetical protein